MSMQEIIRAEKERVQRALEAVTEPGATMSIFFPEGDSVQFEVDGFVVLRAMPQLRAISLADKPNPCLSLRTSRILRMDNLLPAIQHLLGVFQGG